MKLQSFQITNLLYLMRSMCVSLGFSESQETMKNQEHDSTSLEQKRAFTGVYYLVTMFVPLLGTSLGVRLAKSWTTGYLPRTRSPTPS